MFGPGEGLKFRQAIAALKIKGTIERSGQGDSYEKPAWSHIWDYLHDADIEGGLHSPEGLGRVLQDNLDFRPLGSRRAAEVSAAQAKGGDWPYAVRGYP